MRRSIIATTAALTTLGVNPAIAGSMSEPAVEPAPAPVMTPAPTPMGGDWTGFYAGGSLGYADATGTDAFDDSPTGITYGAFAGYDYDFGSIVLGGELEISGFDVTEDTLGLDVDSVTRVKVRAGYDAGNALPYLTAGGAQLSTSGAVDDSDTGYFYGAGLDYRIGGNLRVGGEVLQHRFEDYAGSGIDVDATTIGARVAFEF